MLTSNTCSVSIHECYPNIRRSSLTALVIIPQSWHPSERILYIKKIKLCEFSGVGNVTRNLLECKLNDINYRRKQMKSEQQHGTYIHTKQIRKILNAFHKQKIIITILKEIKNKKRGTGEYDEFIRTFSIIEEADIKRVFICNVQLTTQLKFMQIYRITKL